MDRPVLLAAAAMPVWPVRDGYSLRAANLLRELAAGWRITLVAPSGAEDGHLGDLEIERFVPLDPTAAELLAPEGPGAAKRSALVRRLLAEEPPDAALLWGGAERLGLEEPAFPPTVLDRIDSMTLASLRVAFTPGSMTARLRALKEAAIYARYERRYVRAFAATVVVGENDAAVLRRVSGRDTVHVVPNGVTLDTPPAERDEAPVPTLVFSGVMAYPPNIDAVRHFAERIWPLVRRAVPEARFLVTGRKPTDEVRALAQLPGIEVTGEVADIAAVLRSSWLAVAPMRTGAGIKNKVLEAWAVGTPVVMTSVATNGLRLDPGLESTIVDDPDQMAETIVHLLRDEAERRRLGALVHAVAGEHGWAPAGSAINVLLDQAAGIVRSAQAAGARSLLA